MNYFQEAEISFKTGLELDPSNDEMKKGLIETQLLGACAANSKFKGNLRMQ
jgi:hypothetical protein